MVLYALIKHKENGGYDVMYGTFAPNAAMAWRQLESLRGWTFAAAARTEGYTAEQVVVFLATDTAPATV